MSDVTVIGLAPMGAALARTLLKAGNKVTVWNRSREKAAPLVAVGAREAASLHDAVMASPMIVLCIDSYRTTLSLFEPADVSSALSGRMVVQLSTGTPVQARAAAPWFASRNVLYLDGAILAGPATIGTPLGAVIYSGAKAAFDHCKPVLDGFGKEAQFVGDDVGAASVLDMAWLTWLYGLLVSIMQGAAVCEAEGVGLDQFASTLPSNDMRSHGMLATIRSGVFGNADATIVTHANAIERMCEQTRDAGVNGQVPQLLLDLSRSAISAGYGNENLAALVKVLRAKQRTIAGR